MSVAPNMDALTRKPGEDRPDWDNYFMGFALVASARGTCDRKHVGAVIVADKHVVATGYNGSVSGLPHCDDVGHDMVEGHCVAGSTVISKFQTGHYNTGHKTVADIYEAWQRPKHRAALQRMRVRGMTPTGLIASGHITDVWRQGEKPVFDVTTFLGRTVRVTGDHRFWTPSGWRPLVDLAAGDSVGLNGQLAETDIPWLVRRYRAGATVQQLAETIGRSRGYVKRRLMFAGVELHTYNGGWNRGTKRDPRCGYKGRNVTASSARDRARRYALADACVVCGCGDGLQVHHIDGDHLNDADENLTTACITCHNIAHTPHAKTETVKFDKIISIVEHGVEPVYDLTVDGLHNFVGDGFVLHNCVRTIHAEMNALAQAARHGVRIEGATIYSTASPCWDCFRVLVNAGIKRFVYAEEYRNDEHGERIQAVAERLQLDVLQL